MSKSISILYARGVFFGRALPLLTLLAYLALSTPRVVIGSELDGISEPFRVINVAADEMGIIEETLVREGERVERGRPLARLNSEVHRALLAISEQGMNSEGRLEAALAESRLRKTRLEKIEALRAEGNARQEELERAAMELEVAEANARSAREERLTKKLEYDRLKVQLERRTIRAPVAGVVTKLHRQPGEFVAPNNPEVLTLVQLDPLLANCAAPSEWTARLEVGQKVHVRFLVAEVVAEGVIDFIAPVTDAESDTFQVKISIDNPAGRLRSGERLKLEFEGAPSEGAASEAATSDEN